MIKVESAFCDRRQDQRRCITERQDLLKKPAPHPAMLRLREVLGIAQCASLGFGQPVT
jgi:hypothetical protein